jgi:hypothetical protein
MRTGNFLIVAALAFSVYAGAEESVKFVEVTDGSIDLSVMKRISPSDEVNTVHEFKNGCRLTLTLNETITMLPSDTYLAADAINFAVYRPGAGFSKPIQDGNWSCSIYLPRKSEHMVMELPAGLQMVFTNLEQKGYIFFGRYEFYSDVLGNGSEYQMNCKFGITTLEEVARVLQPLGPVKLECPVQEMR